MDSTDSSNASAICRRVEGSWFEGKKWWENGEVKGAGAEKNCQESDYRANSGCVGGICRVHRKNYWRVETRRNN